ncbi:MAG: DUF4395 domain-containing protein [Bifidobacteriaceae bacterium]|jgi:Sec-independent protein secretion pathway component TatC|nr:DUF4395 domain-containing protein [Bifidobacteriaceae bacterium]
MSSVHIDARQLRFSAAVSSLVLVLALVAGTKWGSIPLAIQTLVFAAGTLAGLSYQPYFWLFDWLVMPRLATPPVPEDRRAVQSAEGLGLVLTLAAAFGIIFSSPVLFYVATAIALVASLAAAIIGLCAGCELYRWITRLREARQPTA